MMQGYSLSATLPEEYGLGERFWYWRGASGQSYIHSIYALDLCPPVAGAVYVVVRKTGGSRMAVAIGRFGADGSAPSLAAASSGDEVHVHLLARDAEAADAVLRDLAAALETEAAPRPPEPKMWRKPVQLELLAA